MPIKTPIQKPCQHTHQNALSIFMPKNYRQSFMPRNNLTLLTRFRNFHSSSMPRPPVDITEERGTTTPTPPTMGGKGIGRVLPMEKAVLPSFFSLYYLSLEDSSLRTFSAAPCLGRFEPNAPGGGGGDDI